MARTFWLAFAALVFARVLTPPPPSCASVCLRTILWDDVGAVRRTSSLREGAQRLAVLAESCTRLYYTSALCPDTVELRNGVQTGALIAAAAAHNHDSVGTHFVEDDEEHHDEDSAQAAG